jgi:hypothetical protein
MSHRRTPERVGRDGFAVGETQNLENNPMQSRTASTREGMKSSFIQVLAWKRSWTPHNEKPPAVSCRGFSVFQVFRDQKLR